MRNRMLGLLTLVLAGSGAAMAQSPPAPLVISDLSPGMGMWYEDEPAAPPPASAAKPNRLGFFSKWARGSKETAPARDTHPQTPIPDASTMASTPGVEDPAPAYDAPPYVPAGEDHEAEIPDRVPSGGRLYGSSDALFWWMRRGGTPVLATTGTEANPLATTLVKDNNFDDQERVGVRATVGFWLNHEQTLAFEVGGLYLLQRAPSVTLVSNGAQPLARPFIDLGTGAASADILAAAGTQNGAVAVRDLTRLWGAEANFRKELLRGCYYHFDVLAGFRYLEFDEGMQIADQTTFLPASPFAGTAVASSDRFGTHNAFYGGQLGAETEIHWRCVDLDLWGKVGLGTNFQVLNINGTSIVMNPDGTSTGVANGLYAQPTNIGHHTQREFAILPEFGANLGFQVTPHLRATVGYTFLYLSRAVRPGDQIDQTVTPALGAGAAAGATHPALLFRESEFWAQGVNAGLEFRY
jgi:hypothetical protein